MAIKTFEESDALEGPFLTVKNAYDSGVAAAKRHYEAEFVATAEYFDSVLRRTSDLNFDMVKKLVEVADIIPKVNERYNAEEIYNKLKELKQAVEDHDNSI